MKADSLYTDFLIINCLCHMKLQYKAKNVLCILPFQKLIFLN